MPRQSAKTVPVSAYTPEILARSVDPNATPKHMLCAVLLEKADVMIEIHTAGRPVLCRIPVSQAAKSRRLINGMNSDDALSVGVYFGYQKERETIRFYSALIDQLEGR